MGTEIPSSWEEQRLGSSVLAKLWSRRESWKERRCWLERSDTVNVSSRVLEATFLPSYRSYESQIEDRWKHWQGVLEIPSSWTEEPSQMSLTTRSRNPLGRSRSKEQEEGEDAVERPISQ